MTETPGSPSDLGETRPVASVARPATEGPAPRRRRRWLALLAQPLLTALLGAGLGYRSAQQASQAFRLTQVAQVAQEQFRLGVEDLEAGRYELAKQRFEYVIQLDPTFPGAPERLAEVLLVLNQPTSPPPTPVASPTPNLAPVEELFEQAQAAFAAEDWSAVIDTLLLLRAKDPGYRAAEVDGLLYLALRNRGVERIAKEGLLEEGLYDLSLAERFGPLDQDAETWRSWARLYLEANTYMGVDWAQATFYWAQVYLVAPYLRNDAYLKYAISAHNYGDQLMAAGDPCAAVEVYEQSLLAWANATLVPTATKAASRCLTATAPPPAPPPPTATPTPGEGGGETPTPTPTPTPEGGG